MVSIYCVVSFLKMKLFLSLLVVTLAVSAHNESELEFNVFNIGWFDGSVPITDDQIRCIKHGTGKIANHNPDLKSRFRDLRKTGANVKKAGLKCYKYMGNRQQSCLAELKITAFTQYARLMKSLPDNRKEVVDEITTIVKNCLRFNGKEQVRTF